MKKIFIGAAILSFAALLFFSSKNNSLSNVLEDNVDALVEVSNAEYKIKCNPYYSEIAVEEWVEDYDGNSSKKGYIGWSENNYCGVSGHSSCNNDMSKCKKSNHSKKCYHPTYSYPNYWKSGDPL